MSNLTQDVVKLFFHYDPDTGVVRRIKRLKPIPGGTDGTLVDCDWELNKPSAGGYIHARVFGKYISLHRIIWLYMTGKECLFEIDHIDGNRINNKWANLRQVTSSDNSSNRGVRIDNTSGVVGVYKHRCGLYGAQISKNGNYEHLGYYKTMDEAVAVRKEAEVRLGFHQNHGARPAWRE